MPNLSYRQLQPEERVTLASLSVQGHMNCTGFRGGLLA
jgi:hypothetical protein